MSKFSPILTTVLIAMFMVTIPVRGESGIAPSPANASPPRTLGKPGTPSESMKSLDRLYKEYTELPKTADHVDKIFQIHLKAKALRDVIGELNSDMAIAIYDQRYEKLGFYIDHFSGTLAYSDRLLIEIDSIDPNSAYREETWYASMNAGREYGGHGNSTVDTLNKYLKEFPDGKYASQIYYDLGNYYFGLYKYLRYEHADSNRSSCYEYDSNHPLEEQSKAAQAAGIASYKKALDLDRERSMTNAIQLSLWDLTSGKNTEPDVWCDTVD